MEVSEENADVLKGPAWVAPTTGNPRMARALGALALTSYKKIPGVGPRMVKVGNAAVYALGRIPGEDALGQLAMLRVKIKFIPAQKGIAKALDAAAEREGLARDEIEELAVPSYGLSEVGVRREAMGEVTAVMEITGTGSTSLVWEKDGAKKPQKSVPASVKRDHADELKELKAAAKDIQKMLPAQRDRIDQLFLARKTWTQEAWRERYLDHPLVGTIARRVIWSFSDGRKEQSAIWIDGELCDSHGKPVSIAPGTEVSLWHPIDRPVEEVMAWRDLLMAREIRQPFKQAHREVYLLTDAERATEVYSNRFAAHVIRQHQFNALCAVRGWRNTLRLAVDQEFPPASRTLEAWGLRAEFWIEGLGDDYGVHVNETSTFLYLATDQVRFYRADAAQATAHAGGGGYSTRGRDVAENHPVALEMVPPLVLSEILRDVDLFVGVASVGNNPEWSDGGPDGFFRDYWHSYSFGDLSATAQTRRAVLEKLLPRLAIADRCELEDRFLKVRGDIRTYRIHLGSGNILMEPNDQYLCIVPTSAMDKRQDKVFLPFEGDRTLSVILSKALMLAEDREITNRTITSQIRPR